MKNPNRLPGDAEHHRRNHERGSACRSRGPEGELGRLENPSAGNGVQGNLSRQRGAPDQARSATAARCRGAGPDTWDNDRPRVRS